MRRLVLFLVLLLVPALAVPAAVAAAGAGYVETATDDPVSAAPPVTRPATPHCTVTLADAFASNAADDSSQLYSGTLAPPAACPGPWTKVVLSQHIQVSGRQYDRVGTVTVGDAEIYHGTTQEPSGATPTTYDVDTDVTRFASLLRSPQPYRGGIVNYRTPVYTGNYVQTVTLTYYRADRRHPPAAAPTVVGLGDDTLTPAAPTVTHDLSGLPRNITGARVELTLEGSGCDEQWFTAVPDEVAAAYPDAGLCGHGPYREAQVSIDGRPAGATHTFPHIYSGGIVPTLWRPVLAIGTLDLHSESLDVTPFAGLLTDGRAHRLAVTMPGLGDSWTVTANLFLTTDPGGARTSGALVTDRVAPAAAVHTAVTTVPAGRRALVTAGRDDITTGYVDTSAGRVWTTVRRTVGFRHTDVVSDGGLTQAVRQVDSGTQTVRTTLGRRSSVAVHRYRYPIAVDYSAARYVDDQNFELSAHVDMSREIIDGGTGRPARASRENVDSHGLLARTDGVTTASDGRSTSSFVGTDDVGSPYLHRIVTEHGRVLVDRVRATSAAPGQSAR